MYFVCLCVYSGHRGDPLVFHIIPITEDKGHLWITGRTIRKSSYFKIATSATKGEALCPPKPSSLKYWGLENLKGEGVGTWEYEIWRVLVRQFALGMLSTALVPSSAPLWDVVYPRPVNTPTPFPGGEPF